MSEIVIRVENLTKEYRLGTINHGTLYQDLQSWWARLRGKDDPNSIISGHSSPSVSQPDSNPHFLALNNVSFDVKQGEVIGIIGRNGAGKSTLLKILSKVTAPTSGTVKIKGRIASLLEVGTGFHPELTGRENIFLNGTILGMKRHEVQRKFDEIVAFAQIDQFIDTPVKRYSSGMHVRLAFAVAAHLEPEILIVDEVLAVGDAAFQKKCLGKMGDVGKEGRTVLFVSHNMGAVQNLCLSGIVLESGMIRFYGSQTEAVNYYLGAMSNNQSLKERKDRVGSGAVRVAQITFQNESGQELDTLMSGQEVNIQLHFMVKPGVSIKRAIASISFRTTTDIPVFLHHNRLTADDFGELPTEGIFCCRIKSLPLPSASYLLDFSIVEDGEFLDLVDAAAEINVVHGDFFGNGEIPPISHGVCLVNAEWSLL